MRESLKAVCTLLATVLLAHPTAAAPPGFPASGNGLWYTTPGTIWSREYLPVGNGFLAAMTPGGTTQEITQLNIESLWSGGPFADPSYNGGNKLPSERPATAQEMQNYRQSIMNSSTGTIDDISDLTSPTGAYGSYSGAAYLVSNLKSPSSASTTNYARFLDLDKGHARAIWQQEGATFTRETFCSNPTQLCGQNTTLDASSGLKSFSQTYAFAPVPGNPQSNITCSGSTGLRLTGLVSEPGMAYEILAVVRSAEGRVSCSSSTSANGTANSTVTVSDATSASIIWVGGTNYDINAGDAEHNFSFAGPDPRDSLQSRLNSVSSRSYDDLLNEHQADYTEVLTSSFTLDLGQKADLNTPTDTLLSQYEVDTGNPYLELLLFNYGRYLLMSSARGVLPANLQGKWADGSSNAWSADYHSNINLQMNYWMAETTNLDVTTSLFNYIQKTWAPRGAETAHVLYNISEGWVTHDEMNIFGHTGMKDGTDNAEWADYPESNAWMMLHVWDHFDFTYNVSWWKTQGYPLLKSVAQFHMQKLIPDAHFNDGSLVVAPCNSPEQPPITLACSHAQQLIWQLFNAVEKGFQAAGDADEEFLAAMRAKRAQMDVGIHIGSWGQLQEWKVDMDQPNDTHRHLSHLVGLYPGYAISNYNSSVQVTPRAFSKSDVFAAAETSLIHRGNGTGPDADSGWEKVWRAASWTQLGNASEFYHELTYAMQRNFGANLFSLYDPFDADPIFQIDANLGYPAAVMNALIQAPDVPSFSTPLTVTLLPALPTSWSSGSIKGARVRGGITVDFTWQNGKPQQLTMTVDKSIISRPVHVVYAGQTRLAFATEAGMKKTLNF